MMKSPESNVVWNKKDEDKPSKEDLLKQVLLPAEIGYGPLLDITILRPALVIAKGVHMSTGRSI